MADIRLSSRAEIGLAGIADYTIETFGVEQARRYRDELEACFLNLAENPGSGRSSSLVMPAAPVHAELCRITTGSVDAAEHVAKAILTGYGLSPREVHFLDALAEQLANACQGRDDSR